MAFLQNLIVTGSSKFLNKLYATDIDVSGTFSTSGDISVGGTLNVTGTSNLQHITTSGNVAINGGLELSHATPYIDFHFGKSTANYTSRIIEASNGILTISNGIKTASGEITTATITTANISTSNMSTGIAENLNVTNKLHATHFDLQSVAQLGGAFYVSPTIKFPTNSSTTFTITKNGATANIIISDSAINSTTIAGVVWGANAKIKASGKIGTVTTGTMDGTVTAINTSSHTLTISVFGENSSSITAGTYTSTDIDNFCVMMYNTGTYPVGIIMNSYGTDGRTYIDIYGGTSAATEPNVRIGNLGGLSFNGGTLSNQWGIYTNNGYYTGAIVANSGQIGGFTIGTNAIYTNLLTDNTMGSIGLSSYNGTETNGSDGGFQRTIGGISRTNLRFAIGDKFGITGDGVIYGSNIQVSGGKIGGWNIASDFLYNYSTVTTGTASTQYGFRLCVGTSQTNQIIRAGSRSYNGSTYGSWVNAFYVRNDGYMYATSGNIGGWGINTDNGLIHGTLGNADSVFLIPKGSTGAKAIGGSASTVSGWTLTSGENFGVTKTGALYCSDVHATGEITATSGYIGTATNGFTIDSSGFYSGTKTANTSGYISLSNSTFSRTINGTATNNLNFAIGSKFGVTSDGTLYANGLNITGINADNITLGTVNIARLTSIEVGGRNFLLGTKGAKSVTLTNATGNYYIGYFEESDYGKSITNGNTTDYFTVSFEWSTTSQTGVAWIQIDGNIVANVLKASGYKTNQKSEIDLSQGSGKYVGTFRLTETQASKTSQRMRIRIAGDNVAHTAGSTFTMWNLKFEKGNTATQWSVAPEDIDSDISDAAKTAKNYLYYDSTNGLVISSSASAQTYAGASVGYNTRLTNSALQIRNGTKILASYGDTVIIGETNKAHQVLDSNSLKFISHNGDSLFEIENYVEGEGSNENGFYDMEITSSLTASQISSELADALNNISSYYLTSRSGDYVQNAFITNTFAKIYISGFALNNNSDPEDYGTMVYSSEQEVPIETITNENGELEVEIASTTSSDWVDLATEFLNNVPSNHTFEATITFNINLIYPTIGIAMTFGSRNQEDYATKGIGSVSMGENNLVSGKYSYAFGRDLTVYDDYSVVVGESNALILNASTGEIQEAAFAVGANGETPFAILKNGTIMMSSVNTGKYPETFLNAGTKKEVSITFEQEYPNPPFIFLTLSENNVTNITDYGRMQLYLKSVTTTGFKVDMVNGSTGRHDFGFNWFAICVNTALD